MLICWSPRSWQAWKNCWLSEWGPRLRWSCAAPQKVYRDKCEKVSPGLFAKLCLTASSARKKTVSSLHQCRRRDRRRRDSRRCHKGRGGRAVAAAAIAMQWLKYSNTALLLFPKAFSWGQRNLIKTFYNQADTPLITKIALKISFNNFSQHSRLKKNTICCHSKSRII